MSEDKDLDEDSYGDLWIWENQCFEEVENQPNYESQLQQERDLVNQKLWHLFQNSATCIAQLHKGSSSSGMVERNSRWMPFQTAAGSVTALYKESMDSIRRCTELGVLHGQQRRTRDLATFLRRRRLIRREDLLAFLCGKSLPPSLAGRHAHRSSPRPHLSLVDRTSPRLGTASILVTAAPPAGQAADGLQPFRDALALSSLQGAMSAVSFRPPSPAGSAAAPARRRSPGRRHLSGSPGPGDLSSVKRPATPSSPSDVVMDSPTHKRPRLI